MTILAEDDLLTVKWLKLWLNGRNVTRCRKRCLRLEARQRGVGRYMTETKNEKELAKPSTVEPFHTAARLRGLAAEATTLWVKQHSRLRVEERATDGGRARGLETKLTLGGARV